MFVRGQSGDGHLMKPSRTGFKHGPRRFFQLAHILALFCTTPAIVTSLLFRRTGKLPPAHFYLGLIGSVGGGRRTVVGGARVVSGACVVRGEKKPRGCRPPAKPVKGEPKFGGSGEQRPPAKTENFLNLFSKNFPPYHFCKKGGMPVVRKSITGHSARGIPSHPDPPTR